MNKNIELLESFQEYCLAHPEQRFWQALRNWAGAEFVYIQLDGRRADGIVWVMGDEAEYERTEIFDTFYLEDKTVTVDDLA